MNPTKARMLLAARDLLLHKGVEATAVEDILKATKTGKSQFYHFFGSKAGMVNAVLASLNSEIIQGLWRDESLPVISTWADVVPWLTAVAKQGAHGHPMALLSLSIRPEERAAHPVLLDFYTSLRAPLLTFLETEQRDGRLLAQIKCTELADLALTAVMGATITQTIGFADEEQTSRTAHHLYLYLKAYARA